MNKGENCFRIIYFLFFLFFFIPFFSTQAIEYQRVSLGDTIRIGEFLFEDDYTPSIADCTLTIHNPAGTLKFTGIMTENANGWHFHDFAVGGGEALGNWPTSMACGTAGVDLVIVDKTFTVIPIKGGWTVTLSDFGETTVNTAYKAKLQVLNYLTVPTDAASLPTVVITDPVGTVQVPAGVMTKDSNGTYSYSYSISASAIGGVWETVVSVVINGQTVKVNDYWSLSSSPADVKIIGITDKVVPTITASVRIDNMGTSASDFYYVYCIVSSENNLCGGNDDTAFASATAFINAGSFINLSLTLDEVPTAGTYWFKVKARALAETNWAAATKQFNATEFIIVDEKTFTVQPADPMSTSSPQTEEGSMITLDALSGFVDHPARFVISTFAVNEVLAVYPATSGKSANYIFQISATDLETGAPITSFNKVITIRFLYGGVPLGNLLESSLRLYRLPSGGSVWVILDDGSVDEQNNIVSGKTQNFSYFGVFGGTASEQGPTPTPAPSGGGGGGGGGGVTPSPSAVVCSGADFNKDGIVNSVDFSILLYFWKTQSPFRNSCVDINKDAQVNSVDFSILLYQWGKPGVNIK